MEGPEPPFIPCYPPLPPSLTEITGSAGPSYRETQGKAELALSLGTMTQISGMILLQQVPQAPLTGRGFEEPNWTQALPSGCIPHGEDRWLYRRSVGERRGPAEEPVLPSVSDKEPLDGFEKRRGLAGFSFSKGGHQDVGWLELVTKVPGLP